MSSSKPRAILGRTGIAVSPLCFGTIPLGPARGLPQAEAVDLLRGALALGVNFLDTAEIYDNYEVIRLACRRAAEPAIVATKSYASDASGMRASLERARRGLDRETVDLFLLHEVESAATLRGHRGALDYLLAARGRGLVKAVGISTHTVAGVRAACALPELDVIHPLINRDGIGIKDGTAREMAEAIETAAQLGLGIYAMKALAGGHLNSDAPAALAFVRDLPGVASVAVGIQSRAELLVDWACLNREDPPADALAAAASVRRRLFVEAWCAGCGECLSACPFGLLRLEEGRVAVREADCLLCGYCVRACANMCLKVV